MQKDTFSPNDIVHEGLTQFSDDMHDEYVNMDNYAYYSDSLYAFNDHDQMEWDGPLTPVPGFGFYPKRVNDELVHMTQVRLLFRVGSSRILGKHREVKIPE
jgi:hypothetical protein